MVYHDNDTDSIKSDLDVKISDQQLHAFNIIIDPTLQ